MPRKTRIYVMIKRLGFFTIFIISCFFIFGREVLGAGSCGLTYDANAGALIYSGAGLSSDYRYLVTIKKEGDPNYVCNKEEYTSSTGTTILGSCSVSVSGKYILSLIDSAVPTGPCSASVDVVVPNNNNKQLDQECTPSLPGETEPCVSPLVCAVSTVNMNKYYCKNQHGDPDPTLLQEGNSCNPSTGPYCDSSKGLACTFNGYVNGDPSNDSLFACKKVDVPQSGTLTPFPDQFISIPELITAIIKFSIGIAGVVAFFLLAIGSYKFMLSSGDPKALQSAQETISSAIAGLVLIILAVTIFGIMSGILKIPGIEFTGTQITVPSDNIPVE